MSGSLSAVQGGKWLNQTSKNQELFQSLRVHLRPGPLPATVNLGHLLLKWWFLWDCLEDRFGPYRYIWRKFHLWDIFGDVLFRKITPGTHPQPCPPTEKQTGKKTQPKDYETYSIWTPFSYQNKNQRKEFPTKRATCLQSQVNCSRWKLHPFSSLPPDGSDPLAAFKNISARTSSWSISLAQWLIHRV